MMPGYLVGDKRSIERSGGKRSIHLQYRPIGGHFGRGEGAAGPAGKAVLDIMGRNTKYDPPQIMPTFELSDVIHTDVILVLVSRKACTR